MWFERLFGFIELANVPFRQGFNLIYLLITCHIILTLLTKGHAYRGVAVNPDLNKKIQSCFDLTQDERGFQSITSRSNGRVFPVGKFSTPKLSELRQSGMKKLLHSSINEVHVEHVAVDDLIELHAKRDGGIFQAASTTQF